MREVLVLRDLECIKAIVHPRRIDILKTFGDLPLSAKQLSQLLDEPHAKVNYHIKTLYRVGILELVEEKIKSGIVEKYYYPSAKNIIISKKILDFSVEGESEEERLNISKFENISELFYKAAEQENITNQNIVEYRDVCITSEELLELNRVLKSKLDEIINKRNFDIEDSDMDNDRHKVVLLSIPTEKKSESLAE
ncbi:ArsR/SmtB family transcription factor [Asaccharospora irregularis]|uniref:Predicted transcriptional regulator n=1 Tax=Asaccharospora irregularis DSM 2635 TaxID=1121321 RepID=A0A1M5JGV7_9FIRM|nr:helix-turn-helix domain-containing protein [Asaccharospora irregularis]SHG39792.1 Predicted transcriptional regulator [Asaccharospora irregularis DSM 2635]